MFPGPAFAAAAELPDPPTAPRVSAPALPDAAQMVKRQAPVPQSFVPQDVSLPVVAAAPAEPPVMTIARQAAAVGVASTLPTLLGGGPGVLVDSPMSWMVLAAVRRQTAKPAAANQLPAITWVSLSLPNATTGAVTGWVRAADPDGDPVSYKATTSARGAVTISATGVFTYTPTAAARHAAAKVGATTATKTDVVTVTVTDGKGGSAIKPVTVTILAGNAVPVTATTVGTPNVVTGVVSGSVTATDADRDTLTYSAAGSTKGTVSINPGTGGFTYTPTPTARHAAAKLGAASAAQSDKFIVTVTDGYGARVAVPVTVSIAPRNAVPVAGTTTVGSPNATTGVVTGAVTATDADKDPLTYSAPASTAKGSVSLNSGTGAFVYTPNSSARTSVAGTDSFTVTVADGYGGSTPVSVSVPVAPKAVASAGISVTFNYGAGASYWSADAKRALQDAAETLAAYFVVATPVTLVFDVTAEKRPLSSTLAATGSDLISSGPGFFDTVVQKKILTGVDANGSAADGSIEVNFGNPWAYGDSVSGSQYDFTSTMIHEMLHAYGFLAYVDEAGWNSGTTWTKFDSFIMTSAGTRVINPSTYRFNIAYNGNLTGRGGGLFFGGPNAVAAYGGRVPLYTPSPWETGSSVSHLDDFTFTGAKAQMMNALADTGPSPRTLSAVEIGILKDLGYTVKTSVLFVGVVFLRRRKPRA